MRITNNIVQQRALANMQSNLQQIAEASSRVTTGLRIQRPSDDPAAASAAMRTRSSIRALDQYRSAIDMGRQRMDAEEMVLGSLTQVLSRAKQLAVSQAGATADAGTRDIAKIEIEQLLRHAVSLGNTMHGDVYLFGGGDPSVPPYGIDDSVEPVNFTTTSPTGELKVRISAQQLVATNHNGSEVFDDTGALAAIRDLAAALDNNDPDAIRTSMVGIDDAFEGVQNLLGEIGGRMNQLQVTGSNLDALEINLLSFKSDLEEVDIEKAITELVGRQTAFQAAMLATSKVMSLTLADYLR